MDVKSFKDLILTNEFIFDQFIKQLNLEADYLYQENYDTGEPSDEMVDMIISYISDKSYDRIIAVKNLIYSWKIFFHVSLYMNNE